MMNALQKLEEKIVTCRKCPRLVEYIDGIRAKYPSYWCKPVPGFGDENAAIMLLGLAPGRFGSNRTGRMFTGDASGNFLYPALHKMGLANQPNATENNDGLQLQNVFITAVGRCAPPQNKPTPQELKECLPYVAEEIKWLPKLRVVLALGKIAHDNYLRLNRHRLALYPFKHGAVYAFENGPILVDSYHPSRQNTNTGVLTEKMFLEVLSKTKQLAGIG